jgi:hypothetical protein
VQVAHTLMVVPVKGRGGDIAVVGALKGVAVEYG